jgi:hypothetical protein
MTKQIKPPFTLETAKMKVQRAEDLWNGKDPEKVALAYTENSTWRNRSEFVQGRASIAQFLSGKWQREIDYKLKKELFIFSDDRIAVDFQYEYRNESGQWFRAYGLEHWQFDEEGLMHTREASINELAIDESERKL